MLEVIALEKLDNEEEMELHKFIEDENKPTATSEHAASVQPEIGRQTGTAEWRKARGEDGGEDGARHWGKTHIHSVIPWDIALVITGYGMIYMH